MSTMSGLHLEQLQEVVERLRTDNEHLRNIIRDLLWNIGHDDEQALLVATGEARRALEKK